MENLPVGYRMRPARMDDLGAVVEMLNASSRELFGLEQFTEEDFEVDWSTPRFDLETDTCLVVAPDGRVAGYYDVFNLSEPFVRASCWGQVHPEHVGKGIGWALLSWAEARARQSIPRAPEQARVVLVGHAPAINRAAKELFLEAGFSLVRHYLRMVIELNGQPREPEWPEGIILKGFLMGEDDQRTVEALRDSFSDHWGIVEKPFEDELAEYQNFWCTYEKFDPTLYFLAMDGDEVAGISLCLPAADDDPEMGWVQSLGVRRPWRRQGLGLALLLHSFREFQQRGRRRVGLGVDAESLTGATRLYIRAGMHPDPRWQTSGFEKELRPGKELRKQSLEQGGHLDDPMAQPRFTGKIGKLNFNTRGGGWMAIKAVIWDLGGVILRTEDFSPRQALADRIGKSRLELEDLVFDGDSGDRAQLGEISVDEHWENIRRKLDLDAAGMGDFRRQFWEGDQLDVELVDMIRRLRGRYKTGLLSNAFSDLRQVVTARLNFSDAFDEMVISAELHLVKPDPRIYQAALQRLGAAAQEAVFIDDVLRNVEGARSQGLHAIHFRQRSQALVELERLLEGGEGWMKQS